MQNQLSRFLSSISNLVQSRRNSLQNSPAQPLSILEPLLHLEAVGIAIECANIFRDRHFIIIEYNKHVFL